MLQAAALSQPETLLQSLSGHLLSDRISIDFDLHNRSPEVVS